VAGRKHNCGVKQNCFSCILVQTLGPQELNGLLFKVRSSLVNVGDDAKLMELLGRWKEILHTVLGRVGGLRTTV
jgi:hypothetical protein